MLGRRHLRAKVMQAIYAYNASAENMLTVEKNMFNSIDKIYDLYIYILNFMLTLHDYAQNRIEIRKHKKLPTAEDLNPNMRFIENPIFAYLADNTTYKSYSSKNKQISWDITDKYIIEVYKAIEKSRTYEKYLAIEKPVFMDHKKFLLNIFRKYIASDTKIAEWYEDYEISWYDDYYIANSMVYKTLEGITEEKESNFRLFSVFKDEEDKLFTKDLYRKTIALHEDNKKIITQKTMNWDIERIAKIDYIILELAITEFKEFANIPPRVTLNEYIEIAKDYSSENSTVFINGILHQVMKDFEDRNLFKKTGRGLIS